MFSGELNCYAPSSYTCRITVFEDKILQNLHLLLSYVVPVKSKEKISQNFVAFSEYMNFNFVSQQKAYLLKYAKQNDKLKVILRAVAKTM